MPRGRENTDGRYKKIVRELWGRGTLMIDRGKEKQKGKGATLMADTGVEERENGGRNTNDRQTRKDRGWWEEKELMADIEVGDADVDGREIYIWNIEEKKGSEKMLRRK